MNLALGFGLNKFRNGALLNPNINWTDALKFAIIGQSNASGRGLVAGGEESTTGVQMLGNDYAFKQASEPVDNWTDQVDMVSDDRTISLLGIHGFSLKAGKDVRLATGKKITLIPCAKGSTSLLDWMPSANTLDRNTLFGSAKYRASIAAANGLTAFWLFGHETDAYSEADYGQVWYTYLTRFKQYFGNHPFIFAQLAKHTGGVTNTKQNTASNYQRKIETGYNINPLVVGEAIINTDFVTDAWTSGVPTGWTLVNSNATNYIEQNARGIRFKSDGSLSVGIRKTNLSIGTTYLVEIDIAEITAVGVKTTTANESLFIRPLIYRQLFTATAANFNIYRLQSGVNNDAVVRSVKVYPYTSGELYNAPSVNNMIVTFDLPLVDEIHLDTTAQIEVGRRMALATRQHVLGHEVNGTGPRLISSGSFTHPSADKSKVKITWNKAINDGSATKYNSQFRVYDGVTEMTVSSAVRDVDGVSVLLTMSATASGTVTVSYGDVAATGTGIWLHDVVQDSDLLPAPQFSKQTVV